MSFPKRLLQGSFYTALGNPETSPMKLRICPSKPFTLPDTNPSVSSIYKIPFRFEEMILTLTNGVITSTNYIAPTEGSDPADVFYWVEHVDSTGKKWMERWTVAKGTPDPQTWNLPPININDVVVKDASSILLAELGEGSFVRTTGGIMTGLLQCNAGIKLPTGQRVYLDEGSQTYFEAVVSGANLVLNFYIQGIFVGSIQPS